MPNKVKIAPSILSADFARLGGEVRALSSAGADYIHIDVMDGHFVPNLTFGPMIVKALRPYSSLTFDVHLMVAPVDAFVEAFAEAGADIITVHAEAGPHLHRSLRRVRDLGKRVGLALNPATPVRAAEDLLGEIDLLLLMSVNPGFGGQSFIPRTLERARLARALIAESGGAVELEVDGGINAETAALARAAGIDVLVAGTAVLGDVPPDATEPDRVARYARRIAALRGADGVGGFDA